MRPEEAFRTKHWVLAIARRSKHPGVRACPNAKCAMPNAQCSIRPRVLPAFSAYSPVPNRALVIIAFGIRIGLGFRIPGFGFGAAQDRPAAVRMGLTAFLALLAATMLSGCLLRPSLVRQSFSFAAPPASTNSTPSNGRILAIRGIRVAAPYDSQSLVYRTGEFSYERDPYAQFLVAPAASLRQPLRAYLANSGLFEAVATPGSALLPNMLVEVFVQQLYGDLRDLSHPAAVLDMSFVFFDAPSGTPGKVLLRKDYARRILVQARTAAAIVAGWSKALEEILAAADSDLRKAAQADSFH